MQLMRAQLHRVQGPHRVLRVCREDVDTMFPCQGQDIGPAGNERLFVGQADVLACLDCRHRWVQSRAPCPHTHCHMSHILSVCCPLEEVLQAWQVRPSACVVLLNPKARSSCLDLVPMWKTSRERASIHRATASIALLGLGHSLKLSQTTV